MFNRKYFFQGVHLPEQFAKAREERPAKLNKKTTGYKLFNYDDKAVGKEEDEEEGEEEEVEVEVEVEVEEEEEEEEDGKVKDGEKKVFSWDFSFCMEKEDVRKYQFEITNVKLQLGGEKLNVMP